MVAVSKKSRGGLTRQRILEPGVKIYGYSFVRGLVGKQKDIRSIMSRLESLSLYDLLFISTSTRVDIVGVCARERRFLERRPITRSHCV